MASQRTADDLPPSAPGPPLIRVERRTAKRTEVCERIEALTPAAPVAIDPIRNRQQNPSALELSNGLQVARAALPNAVRLLPPRSRSGGTGLPDVQLAETISH